MKRDNVNYVAVGLFVLSMLAVLVFGLFQITGRSGPSDRYHVIYKHVSGIQFGTPVYFEGYRVGQVEGVSPLREGSRVRYRVDVSVAEGWPIPEDSEAQMASSGLLSSLTINIRQGISPELLVPGEQIPGREGGDVFQVLNNVALDMNELAHSSIKPLLDRLNQQLELLSTDLEQHGPAIIKQGRALVDKLNEGADRLMVLLREENRRTIDDVLDNARVVSQRALEASDNAVRITRHGEEAARNLARLSRDIEGTRDQVDGLLALLRDVVDSNRPEMEASLGDLRRILDVASRHVERVAYHMEGTSRNMHEFSRQIRQNPSLLLGGASPPRDERGLLR